MESWTSAERYDRQQQQLEPWFHELRQPERLTSMRLLSRMVRVATLQFLGPDHAAPATSDLDTNASRGLGGHVRFDRLSRLERHTTTSLHTYMLT